MTTEQKHDFWRQHIEAWRRSKLPQREYCTQQSLSYSSFGYWSRRLKNTSTHQSKLLPIKVTRTTPLVVILPCGIRLELPSHALAEILPVLLHAVQEQA